MPSEKIPLKILDGPFLQKKKIIKHGLKKKFKGRKLCPFFVLKNHLCCGHRSFKEILGPTKCGLLNEFSQGPIDK